MLRGVVTFLVSFQLFLPPGMCVCQLAPVVKEVTGVTFRDGSNAEPSRSRCSACHGHEAFDRELTPHELTTEAPQQEPNPPEPTKHFPGCPAELGDMPTKMTASTITLEFDEFEVVSFFEGSVISRIENREKDRLNSTPHSPPFFISHCALLI